MAAASSPDGPPGLPSGLSGPGSIGARSPDAAVCEAETLHLGGIVDVPEIDDDGGLHQALQSPEIELTELVPLGRDDEGVGPLVCLGLAPAEKDVRKNAPGAFHGNGIVGPDLHPPLLEDLDESERRRLADIVRVRLERQTENGGRPSLRVPHRFAYL